MHCTQQLHKAVSTSNTIGYNIDNRPAVPVDLPWVITGVVHTVVVVVKVVVVITCVVEAGDTVVELLSITVADTLTVSCRDRSLAHAPPEIKSLWMLVSVPSEKLVR